MITDRIYKRRLIWQNPKERHWAKGLWLKGKKAEDAAHSIINFSSINGFMFLIPEDHWEVRCTKEKGKGIFAKKEIKAGTIIGDYLGKIIKTAEYDLDKDKKGLFLMYFTDRASIYPDLKKPGIHLLNHSCSPNCWIYTFKGHTLFFALRKIEPGEEPHNFLLTQPKR